MDLRGLVCGANDDGVSCRAAAVRFGVAPLTATRWKAQLGATGGLLPEPQGGNMRSQPVEERASDIRGTRESRKGISFDELDTRKNPDSGQSGLSFSMNCIPETWESRGNCGCPLIAAGKPAKIAITAVMRKLVVTANALLKANRFWAQSQT